MFSLLFRICLGGCLIPTACASPVSQLPDSYRYRLTVEVETPTGPATGSGVIEVGLPGFRDGKLVDRSRELEIKGQAVPIDLPNGQTLFALLGSKDSADWAVHVMPWLTPQDKSIDYRRAYFAWLKDMLNADYPKVVPADGGGRLATPETPESFWPSFARFDDPREPKTFALVNPHALDQIYGPGYSVKSIKVELTEYPVTTGLEKRLPWVSLNVVKFIDVPPGPVVAPVPGSEVSLSYFTRSISD